MSRGAFIVIEGIDGSGKSTLAARLVAYFDERKVDAVPYKFPDRSTPVGQLLDTYLTGKDGEAVGWSADRHAVHLLFAANRRERSQDILASLHHGITVICDRYVHSGLAYSLANGLDEAWCLPVDNGLPAPDLVLYLSADVGAAAKRAGFGAERYENKKFQGQVKMQYARLFDESAGWIVLDANQPADILFEDAVNVAAACVCRVRVQNPPIGRI